MKNVGALRVPTEEELWDCPVLGDGAHGIVFEWCGLAVKVGCIPAESVRVQKYAHRRGYALPVLFYAEECISMPSWFSKKAWGTNATYHAPDTLFDVLITPIADEMTGKDYWRRVVRENYFGKINRKLERLGFDTWDTDPRRNVMMYRDRPVLIDFGLRGDWWYDRENAEYDSEPRTDDTWSLQQDADDWYADQKGACYGSSNFW